jgi:hypothetical protein
MHCPQGAAEAGTWRSSAYKLGTGNRHVVNQQPTGEAARRQTPDARRQQPARAYVAPRYYFRHLQPPLAHALKPTHPQYTHTLNACNCYNIWLATTLHLLCIHHIIIIITIITVIHHRRPRRLRPPRRFPHSVPFSSCFFLFSYFLSSSTVPSTTARHDQCPCH